jgi:hypothetical protein
MYVSPAVRSIRENPVAGESVTLLVEAAEGEDADALASAVANLGSVEAQLEFETVRVRVPHERVAGVCELEGVATVQTDDALAMGADGAGEDVRFDEG